MATETNGTLYVFLHGLVVLHEQKDDLEVVLLQVPGHVYKAGSWLMETEILKDTLTLRGVTAGKAGFAAAQFIIQLQGCALTNHGRAATLHLPRAKEILELLLEEDPNLVSITNPAGGAGFPGGVAPQSVATTLVLVYDYRDENQLFLENHYWEPCATAGAISVHIISTSIGPEGKDHEVETQKALHAAIHNYPGLTFNRKPRNRAPNWNETTSPLYGDLSGRAASGEFIVVPDAQGDRFAFAQAELEGIPPRTIRIGRLGRMKQQGRPIQNLWHEPDPLAANPCDCGPINLH